ncbi:MAG TPA: hypothetical protein VK154_14010 [Chitinophagales bacterium]|nr:hypothetical protein [Chitinophagales bacterium]
MDKIDNAEQLRQAIEALEKSQQQEANGVKTQMHEVYESARPVNLIKSTLKDIGESAEIKDSLLRIPVALVSGYVARQFTKGPVNTSVRSVLAQTLIDTAVDTVKRNPELFNAVAKSAFSLLMNTIRSNRKREK